MLEKYIGRIVNLIYIDQSKRITHRRVKVLSVSGTAARCFCLEQQAPRTFSLDHVLAVQPVRSIAAQHG